MSLRTFGLNTAIDERITYVAGWTGADRNMIYHIASCVLTAYSRTRIFALILQTSFIARAFRIEDTLRTTSFIRITDVLGQTFTFAIIAYRIRTAGR